VSVAETPKLTHVDEAGDARMVDVGEKERTARVARAGATVRVAPSTMALLRDGATPKGDVLATARIAGIQAAKRTAELIPLCHPIALTGTKVTLTLEGETEIRIEAAVRCMDRTGVEMEAMTAASVAALTVYDMLKGVERGIVIDGVRLLEKDGGRSGHYTREEG
jgi:cyclic pyranopterin phosphate synthase